MLRMNKTWKAEGEIRKKIENDMPLQLHHHVNSAHARSHNPIHTM